MINIEIRRPDGKIEIVESKYAAMSSVLFGKIQEATKKAGKGNALRYFDAPLSAEEAKQIKINDMYAKADTMKNYDNAGYLKLRAEADRVAGK